MCLCTKYIIGRNINGLVLTPLSTSVIQGNHYSSIAHTLRVHVYYKRLAWILIYLLSNLVIYSWSLKTQNVQWSELL